MIGEILGIFVLTFFALFGIASLLRDWLLGNPMQDGETVVILGSLSEERLEREVQKLCQTYGRVRILQEHTEEKAEAVLLRMREEYPGLILENRRRMDGTGVYHD